MNYVHTSGKPLDLKLYMFSTCPFCVRVLRAAEELGFALPLRDIHKDPEARAELVRVGGRTTVPCLFINGQPLYESADIIEFLRNEVRPADARSDHPS